MGSKMPGMHRVRTNLHEKGSCREPFLGFATKGPKGEVLGNGIRPAVAVVRAQGSAANKALAGPVV